MDSLDSSTIRHLIFKAKPAGGQVSDLVRTVCDLAVQGGDLQRVPNIEYKNPLADKITAVIWELIIEGVFTPGTGMQHPNLPFLRATEYGLRCFEAGELTPHDPDDYLRRLTSWYPTIDDITLLYLGEALQTFRTGSHLATAVMIGVAAERILLRLVDAVANALDTPIKKQKFEQATNGKKAKKLHDEVLARLNSPAAPALPDLL